MNKLANSTSPYLLQHAQNPVNWYPWGQEALDKAISENKLLIISIGYSACHWCHVMEHESFEDEEVAKIMNEHFINIKVDREERPDIDFIYMDAVQLMTGRGGWPLNCICLPDQRPIYGGTYFKKQDWKEILKNLAIFFQSRPTEAEEYAERLTKGIKQTDIINLVEDKQEFNLSNIDVILNQWKKSFDYTDGGHNRAPKFPMPNNWQFLLKAASVLSDKSLEIIVGLTLEKMQDGGIYDHLEGGFARYSVDAKWHVPHFEKMLYDNAQLVSLYSQAFIYSKNESFRTVVFETLNWIKSRMTSEEGAFYAAIDADSEGVEGKYYVWEKSEIDNILGSDASFFNPYYSITEEGNWEEENTNVLMVNAALKSQYFDLDSQKLLKLAKQKLLVERNSRIAPSIDDKILTSWNALQIKAYIDAYKAFDEEEFVQIAIKNAKYILKNLCREDGGLYRTYKNGKSSIFGFLDDYAFVIESFIALYEVTFDEFWLSQAKRICEYVIINFNNNEESFFYFTDQKDRPLIARKQEIMDNVIPASNSVMAWNLKKLSSLFNIHTYENRYKIMLKSILPQAYKYPSAFSNWCSLLLDEIIGTNEIVITGTEYDRLRKEFEKFYIPNKIMLGGTKGTLPLLQNKLSLENIIYVCINKTCYQPVHTIEEALKQIKSNSGLPY